MDTIVNESGRTITNKAGFPAPMFHALASDSYVGGGDISATRLIGPPRITALRKAHAKEIVEDAANRIWSLLGVSVHHILEKSAPAGSHIKVEKRLSMPFRGIDRPGEQDGWKWIVSAQPDVWQDGILYDYKVTSIWNVILGSHPEWEKQINIQAMLHRYHGDEVREGYIIPIMRDWIVGKARREKDYPPYAAKTIGIPLWPQKEVIDYVRMRVMEHQKAQLAYDTTKDANQLPMCTDEERWYRGHKFAVKFQNIKTGKINKNAKRTFDSLTDAREFQSEYPLPKGRAWAPIEERPGENIRCLDYCDVADFCPFGKALKEARKAKELQAPLVNENEEEGED